MPLLEKHGLDGLLISEAGVVGNDGDGESAWHVRKFGRRPRKLGRLGGVVIPSLDSLSNQFPAMNLKRLLAVSALCALFLAGCSTVDSRIAKNREAFNTWPPGVQDKVVQGQIDIGFTPEQVRVALGEPDRVFTRTTGDGTSQVWSYRDRRPRIGFGVGVGMGSFGGRSGTFG